MRWNGSCGWPTISSSSSSQRSKPSKSRTTYPARSASPGRNPRACRAPSVRIATASPSAVCTENGTRGSSTGIDVTSGSANPAASTSGTVLAGSAVTSAAMSSSGTA